MVFKNVIELLRVHINHQFERTGNIILNFFHEFEATGKLSELVFKFFFNQIFENLEYHGLIIFTPPQPSIFLPTQLSALVLLICFLPTMPYLCCPYMHGYCSLPLGCGNLPGSALLKGHTTFKKLITFYFKCV